MNNNNLTQLIIEEAQRRIFEESYQRIYKCLDLLTEDQVWQRPNEELSSIGNLILHLCGNARQWIISGLGGKEDHRKRAEEFKSVSRCSKWKIKRMMEELETDIKNVINKLSEEELKRVRPVQVFEESGAAILIHVIEHFSYHTGQISWYTKMLTNKDLKYYGRVKL